MHICYYFVGESAKHSSQCTVEGNSHRPCRSVAPLWNLSGDDRVIAVGSASCARGSRSCVARCSGSAHVTRDECLGVSWLRFADARKQSACSAERGGRQRWITAVCRVGRVYPRVHRISAEVHKACAARLADETEAAALEREWVSYASWAMSVWQSCSAEDTGAPRRSWARRGGPSASRGSARRQNGSVEPPPPF